MDPRADTTTTAVSYEGRHIVLSFFVSLIGCATTLELLKRRTSTRGAYNWFLLLASAITMGGVGIWGMHFVGNTAVILENGALTRQILYNSTYTSISFFLPILVLLAAFYMLGISDRAHHLHVALAGVLTGTAVCGMHYVGQLGIENYRCSYHIQNVVGAVIIAVVASLVALSIFFRLRETWTDSWWKRALCGVVLALAVSGMHWTAAVGTIYEWKGDSAVHGHSRRQASIMASSLSIGACIVLLVIAVIRGRNILHSRIKAQRLVLACAYFDEDGRLMVTQEGSLPSEKITHHYIETKFGEDELCRSHATFMWVFKASCNWPAMKDFIPGMKERIESDPVARKYRTGNTLLNLRDDSSEPLVDFAPIFKQLFCVAAQQLANVLHEPLERLGILFEEPLDTGAIYVSAPARGAIRGSSSHPYSSIDVVSGATSQVPARGKYLFLNRQLTKSEAAKFAALGYRFASVGQIAEPLARNMQVNRQNVLLQIERMKLSASADCRPPPGVHLACFIVRPNMHKGFDILVPATMQNQLPFSTIQSDNLSEKQMKGLKRFDDLTINEILRTLVNQSCDLGFREEFRWQLYNSFVKLVDLIGETPTIMLAKFSAKKVQVSCRPSADPNSPGTCILLSVRLLRSIHTTSITKELEYVPLSFFSAQQQIGSDNPDKTFARRLKLEFGNLSADPSSRHKGASNARVSERANSADDRTYVPESPRSVLSKISIGRFHPRRRSDETAIVNREKPNEGTDVEMTAMTQNVTTILGKDGWATQPDMAELMSPVGDKNSWVSELFALFRLETEGWGLVRSGWNLHITVEKSFEVDNKEFDTAESKERKTDF